MTHFIFTKYEPEIYVYFQLDSFINNTINSPVVFIILFI